MTGKTGLFNRIEWCKFSAACAASCYLFQTSSLQEKLAWPKQLSKITNFCLFSIHGSNSARLHSTLLCLALLGSKPVVFLLKAGGMAGSLQPSCAVQSKINTHRRTLCPPKTVRLRSPDYPPVRIRGTMAINDVHGFWFHPLQSLGSLTNLLSLLSFWSFSQHCAVR
ncbi:hypothetical protein ILYODFUR_004942 [Ilyodon furcidens]|uniref:Uncharacterized protein n=1 Tax=Ilyodon furcidens TaxID=33524 RepID=A0ABV0TRZ9_9TELE